ncbi:beta-lactamase-like protein [Blastocladiella britannica]|nr:beta-lactamase-like protein [Blastocladiella britannica]
MDKPPHSAVVATEHGLPLDSSSSSTRPPYELLPIPLSADNYAYALYHRGDHSVVLVDPAHADGVMAAVGRAFPDSNDGQSLKVAAILTTHKHHDHSGGNGELRQRFGCPVYGGEGEGVPHATHELGGTVLSPSDTAIPGGWHVKSMITRCHTRASAMYLVTSPGGPTAEFPPCLFSGDTLFYAGAGMFFEGNAAEMLAIVRDVSSALNSGLLPSSTILWPGHEYAHANLQFLAEVVAEPDHSAVLKAELGAIEARMKAAGTGVRPPFSLRTSLLHQLTINPFFRADQPALVAWADRWLASSQQVNGKEEEQEDAVKVVATLRRAKDAWKQAKKQ